MRDLSWAWTRPSRSSARCRHPEVLAVLHGEPRRMGHKRKRPSFETPRKRAVPQDEGGVCGREDVDARDEPGHDGAWDYSAASFKSGAAARTSASTSFS